jgi:hypothetical protein
MAELKIKNVRLSFPDLFEAKQYQGQGPFNYGATFLVEPNSENDKLIRAEITRVAKAAWPKTWEKDLSALIANPMKTAYVSGDTKTYDGYAGMMALTGKRNQDSGRPVVVNRRGAPVQPGDDGTPYGGCYVNAAVEIWAQDNNYGKGVRCTLVGVMFAKDGDSFGGTKPADANVFADLVCEEEEEALV